MKFTMVDLNEQRVAASALTTSIYGPVSDKVKNLFYSTYVQGAIKEARRQVDESPSRPALPR